MNTVKEKNAPLDQEESTKTSRDETLEETEEQKPIEGEIVEETKRPFSDRIEMLDQRIKAKMQDDSSEPLKIPTNIEEVLTKRKGRKGVLNKRTVALAERLDEMGAHPEVFLAQVMMDNDVAIQFRMQAAVQLMKYRWPQPIAAQIQVEEKKQIWEFRPSVGFDGDYEK